MSYFQGEITLHVPAFYPYIITDTYASLGLRMGENFLIDLMDVAPMKSYIENESRIENGKRIIPIDKVQSRDVTLTFTITGKGEGTAAETSMWERREKFINILKSGWVGIEIQAINTPERRIYWLLYQGKGNTFGMNVCRNFCNISLKFVEPNPEHHSVSNPPYSLD